MSNHIKIRNFKERPFDSFAHACWLRDILNQHTEQRYQVTLEPKDQGYLVEIAPMSLNMIEKGAVVPKKAVIVPSSYRQALRSWVLYFPIIILGLGIIMFPIIIWELLFELLQVRSIPHWVDLHFLFLITQIVGLLIMIVVVIRIVWVYYSDKLNITEEGVERKIGIIARQSISLRYSDIRSIGIQQSIFQRVLGIGMLEFSSAGTNGYDIRFDNILNPEGIKKLVQYAI